MGLYTGHRTGASQTSLPGGPTGAWLQAMETKERDRPKAFRYATELWVLSANACIMNWAALTMLADYPWQIKTVLLGVIISNTVVGIWFVNRLCYRFRNLYNFYRQANTYFMLTTGTSLRLQDDGWVENL